MLKKIIILLFVTYMKVRSESSEGSSSEENISSEEQSLLRKLQDLSLGNNNVLDLLAGSSQYENYNITLVAWQNIHSENGNLNEIRTLELVIPAKINFEEDDSSIDVDEYMYDGFLDEASALQEAAKEVASGRFQFSREVFNEDGTEYFKILLADNFLYGSLGGNYAIYNRTIEQASQKEVDAFVKAHHQKHTWDTAVLAYDENGNLIEEKSHISAPLKMTVLENDLTPPEIVNDVIEVVAESLARNPSEDGSKIFYNLGKSMPEYTWSVVQDPDGYYVTSNFSLKVQEDTITEKENPAFYIYALKN